MSDMYPIVHASQTHTLRHMRYSITSLPPRQRALFRVRPFELHDCGRIDAAEVTHPPVAAIRRLGAAARL